MNDNKNQCYYGMPGTSPYFQDDGNLSSNDKRQLSLYASRTSIDIAAKTAEKQDTYAKKVDFLDRLEEKQQRKSLFTDEVYFNKAGEIVHVRLDPKGDIVGGTVICHTRCLKLIELSAFKEGDKYVIYTLCFIDGTNTNNVSFYEKDFTVKGLMRIMRNAGIHIHMNSDTKNNIPSLVFSLLKEKMIKNTIPFSTGWNFIGDGWKWINQDEMTYKEVSMNAK